MHKRNRKSSGEEKKQHVVLRERPTPPDEACKRLFMKATLGGYVILDLTMSCFRTATQVLSVDNYKMFHMMDCMQVLRMIIIIVNL